MSLFSEEIHAFQDLANTGKLLFSHNNIIGHSLKTTKRNLEEIKQIFAELPDVQKEDIRIYIPELSNYINGRRMSSRINLDSATSIVLSVDYQPPYNDNDGNVVPARFVLVIGFV